MLLSANGRVKITDFGSSRVFSQARGIPGVTVCLGLFLLMAVSTCPSAYPIDNQTAL
jgi:serine/threonine protein kinase